MEKDLKVILKLRNFIRRFWKIRWDKERLTLVSDSHFVSAEKFIRSELNVILLEWLDDLNFETILDIGSQEGQFVFQLENKDITCIDIVEKTVRQGKERHPEFTWLCDDFRTCKFNQTYDMVICLNALYYFYDKNIWAKLKQVIGKYLLLSFGDENWIAYHSKIAETILTEAGKWFKTLQKKRMNGYTSVLYENPDAA